MGLFQVMFRCCDALTGEGLEGVVCELSHCGRGLQSARSDRRGVCCFDGVSPGVYCLRETIAPPGYQRNPRLYRCVMDCNGSASVCGVPAHRAVLISFPICGSGGGCTCGNGDTCTCRDDGVVGFEEIGSFGCGDKISDCGGDALSGFTPFEPGARTKPRFRVHRLTPDGQPVPGCVLALHRDGQLHDEAISGDDGIAEFYNLSPGSYTLAEHATPSGAPDDNRHEVHITAQGVVRIDGVRAESITIR